jgi:hypothetical protein
MSIRRAIQAFAAVVLAMSGVTVTTAPVAAAVDDAAFVSQVAPPQTMFSGQTVNVQVTMRNTGSIPWTPADHSLCSRGPSGNSSFGTSSVPLPSVVQPGQTVTFAFTATGPTPGGRYTFQWGIAAGGAVEIGASSPAISVLATQLTNGYQVGYRDVSGTLLNDLFNGNAHIESDSTYNAPAVVGHAETSTVFYGGQYLMFFRDFQGAPTCASGAGGIAIGVARSTDGNTWVADNNGNAVFSVPGGMVYSPSVIVDRDASGSPRLAMTYEINPDCNSAQHVGRAYSYDGDNWTSNADLVLHATSGWEAAGIGTPTLVRGTDGVYRVMYHGYSGSDIANSLRVGFASSSTLDAVMTNKTGDLIGNASAYHPGTWAGQGPGKGDILHEGAYWYMVIEGLRGSVICNSSEISAWGLARTTDPTFQSGWQFSGFNPIRIDRTGKNCGEDMPAFQVIGATPYFVVTPEDPFSLPRRQEQRYRIVEGGRGSTSTANFVGIAATPDSNGYDLVTATGFVFTYGAARYYGGWNGQPLNKPISGMAVTRTGNGYWLVAQDGGIFTFGDAVGYGSEAGHTLNAPIVGMAPTPDNAGYWMVGADGGIFTFGDARYFGSMGGQPLNKPVVGMAATPDGGGYWLVAADGGIFPFGDAGGYGSLGGQTLNAPISGMAATPDGGGYWLVGQDGGVFTFGDAAGIGSTEGQTPYPIVGIAARPAGGYWLGATDGGVVNFGAPYFHNPTYTNN